MIRRMIQLSSLSRCIFFFSLALMSMEVASREAANESDFSYVEGSKNGPSRWGQIRPEWRMCTEGDMQSPIDLTRKSVDVVYNLRGLERSYTPCNAILKNRGHDIMLKWEDGAGSIEIKGVEYVLRQCHWHSLSEHAIEGRRFDLEMHLVHEGPKGEHAVVAILYKYGEPDKFLTRIMYHLADIRVSSVMEKPTGVVDPNEIQLGGTYYSYIGSLTAPPCTEHVRWIILQKVRNVDIKQVEQLRNSVHDDAESNARPLQPVNERNVRLYLHEEDDSLDG